MHQEFLPKALFEQDVRPRRRRVVHGSLLGACLATRMETALFGCSSHIGRRA